MCVSSARAEPFRQISQTHRGERPLPLGEREFFIDNLLVRIYFIIVMIRWTGLTPWEFKFPFPGSLTSTFLVPLEILVQHMEERSRVSPLQMWSCTRVPRS